MTHKHVALILLPCSIVALSGLYLGWSKFIELQPAPRAPAEIQPTGLNLESEDAGDSELSFTQKEVDLGLIKGDLSKDFEYENRSQHVVRILGTKASCCCTVSEPDKSVLRPGAKGRITVHVHLPPDRIGKYAYTIDVDYEGAARGKAQLLLVMQHRPDVLIPDEIRMRSVAGQASKARFTLVDFRQTALRISQVSTTSPQLQVRIVQTPSTYQPGWHYGFEASFNLASRQSGSYKEAILLHTDDPEHKVIKIDIALDVIARVRVLPETLYLTASKDEANTYDGTLFVTDSLGEAVEIKSITSPVGGLKWKIHGENAHALRLDLTLKAPGSRNDAQPVVLCLALRKPVAQTFAVKLVSASTR